MTDKLKVTLTVDGVVASLTLPDDLNIHEATLNRDLSNQPGAYAFFGMISTRLGLHRDRVSQTLRDTTSAASIRVRANAAALGEKTTEDKIAAKVSLEPDVVKAREALQVAERQSSEAALIKDAYYHRLQALISLSANVRKEQSQQSST
jgi:hypothetical protein